MISTLLKLGQELSRNRSKWDDIIEKPRFKDKDEEKKKYVLNIIFDVDNNDIIISPVNLSEYDPDRSPFNHKLIKTQRGNAGKTYLAVTMQNIENLLISLFGKDEDKNGDFIKDIDKKYPDLKQTQFYKALNSLSNLKQKAKEINRKSISDNIGIRRNELLVFCFSSIQSTETGIEEITELSKLEGFEEYINLRFFKSSENNTNINRLCYLSGEKRSDISIAHYDIPKNINAMFTHKTYINFANNFNKKNFSKNYQTSQQFNIYTDRASRFLIDNFNIRIAGIEHVIIPQFLKVTNIDFVKDLEKLKKKSDFVFKNQELKIFAIDIEDEVDSQIYWINFLSYDYIPGQSFKATNLIKDVSKPYFSEIIRALDHVNARFSKYINLPYHFNLYSIYRYIPVNYDLKINEALLLFKDILEHRTIELDIVFKHFIKYLICQRSGQFDNKKRHRAYANISDAGNFDYAIRNAVFHYLAFIQVLKQLNLINTRRMEEKTEELKPIEEISTDFGKRVNDFFTDMNYNDTQKALFYLGRVLNQVAVAQYHKKHFNKPVLNKINYNGMDKDNIVRLRIDLAEKARQYNIVNKVEFNFSKFTNLFNPNDGKKWLSPAENVFYILSGYSFGMVKDENATENNKDEELQ